MRSEVRKLLSILTICTNIVQILTQKPQMRMRDNPVDSYT
jgi:hypothetical protein